MISARKIEARDLDACREMIRSGSLSFHAASRLLPARVRDPALALYAFCRVADDDVDEGRDKLAAIGRLGDRLDRIYAGCPADAPADRAFAAVVERFALPRALPEALLEGLAWDALNRRYADLPALRDYAARVAGSVGVMMCVLMGTRDPAVLARAADLGLAMQLTNIARDVGEDARAGRLFLPTDWLVQAGIDPEAFLRNPAPSAALAKLVARLLAEADVLYARAAPGVAGLPWDCRAGIRAAGLIYGAIGRAVAANGHDSVTRRARTTGAQKLRLVGMAAGQALAGSVLPVSSLVHARPAPETAFLIAAAAETRAAPGRADTVLSILAQLAARDRSRA